MERPPSNLGEASHGKLKARTYLTLFSVIFPLIFPDLWWSPDLPDPGQEKYLFENFYDLVAATAIQVSHSTSNSAAEEYDAHYHRHRSVLPMLFPNHHSKPNHHYAMHSSDLLRSWGPLPALSEFPGERLNGILQNIDTNDHLGEYHAWKGDLEIN